MVSPGRQRQGAPAAADVVLLAELRLSDGVGREGRSERAGLDATGGGRAGRPPRLRRSSTPASPPMPGIAARSARGRGEPRRAAGDIPAQGPHRGDGALSDGAAARRPGSLRIVAGRCTACRPARRREYRGAAATPPRARIVHGARRFGDGRSPWAVGIRPTQVPLALRRARSTRISIDGNAHFCRGLLRTRYGETDDTTFIPLNTLLTKEGALR